MIETKEEVKGAIEWGDAKCKGATAIKYYARVALMKMFDEKHAGRTNLRGRLRHLKGLTTSFGNDTLAVDDSMAPFCGYKVKRQDGEQITPNQVAEISEGVSAIESVVGSMAPLMVATGLTIAHTDGIKPYFCRFGGLYHLDTVTVTVGLTGRNALTHELMHWLEHSTGWEQYTEVEATFIERAKKLMRRTAPTGVAGEREKKRLGPYWRRPHEVYARLFEQFIARDYGHPTFACALFDKYTNRHGYWEAEEFGEVMDLGFKGAIEQRRGALS